MNRWNRTCLNNASQMVPSSCQFLLDHPSKSMMIVCTASSWVSHPTSLHEPIQCASLYIKSCIKLKRLHVRLQTLTSHHCGFTSTHSPLMLAYVCLLTFLKKLYKSSEYLKSHQHRHLRILCSQVEMCVCVQYR